jgi:hypothetical protein
MEGMMRKVRRLEELRIIAEMLRVMTAEFREYLSSNNPQVPLPQNEMENVLYYTVQVLDKNGKWRSPYSKGGRFTNLSEAIEMALSLTREPPKPKEPQVVWRGTDGTEV